ncbi:Putative intracellular protease/amidase [Tenacibaculum sp. MAR_2009_124]|uniref:type 1 glutamine amidotransferase domain-containing protein n=1 Tax=Tenacibaculum sp. MAR_2009_124 TaxID=1250059 RepID=UPI00089502EB|nr:type 1 glutamine amidotransferase domain-containing protein [Tenacibaculum sp. MAR_2009_124]SEB47328.1 Putative intracellular protease/amidase [Tenacibaculum sp. MAR_2009_124]
MFKKYRVLKWISVFILFLIVATISFVFWVRSILPPVDHRLQATTIKEISYISENSIPPRGKILAVVTSVDTMGENTKSTGYELTELSRPYYVFKANGFEVDIASTKGGKAPVVIDDEDMGSFDYAFLNDTKAQQKTTNTIAIENVEPEEYQAIYFVGGKGTMFDFPNNKTIQSIVKEYYQTNKVIGAVCHGPSALVNVRLDNGKSLLESKNVSGFTNEEELFLIPEAKEIFPFLLQDKLTEQGAIFNKGLMYLDKISHDNNLITGQNPWSTWSLAEKMIEQLGYTPKFRDKTDEENAVDVLVVYKTEGKAKAKEIIKNLILSEYKPINRILIAKHAIIGAMDWKLGDFTNLMSLVSFIKDCESKKK